MMFNDLGDRLDTSFKELMKELRAIRRELERLNGTSGNGKVNVKKLARPKVSSSPNGKRRPRTSKSSS